MGASRPADMNQEEYDGWYSDGEEVAVAFEEEQDVKWYPANVESCHTLDKSGKPTAIRRVNQNDEKAKVFCKLFEHKDIRRKNNSVWLLPDDDSLYKMQEVAMENVLGRVGWSKIDKDTGEHHITKDSISFFNGRCKELKDARVPKKKKQKKKKKNK